MTRYIFTLWVVLVAQPAFSADIGPAEATKIPSPVFMCGSGLKEPQPEKTAIFESVPTRPLALSADGEMLFVANSPANCLEIYRVLNGGELILESSVSVGVDPVAVAVRGDSEVWVVNHISDSVSIVDIEGQPHVRQTLQVGDAPWDIVFASNPAYASAGENNMGRAFISASFRGQNHPQFKTQHLALNRLDTSSEEQGELIGRADLWVYDIDQSGQVGLSGIINAFTDSLRSLAVNKAGTRVYATAFKSGNRTTVVPVPSTMLIGEKWSAEGVGHPEPFLIVQENDENKWLDATGRDWSRKINFSISDKDLFIIDAAVPLKIGTEDNPEFNRHSIIESISGIGTTLFNSVYDELENRLFITAIDANNTVAMKDKLKGVFANNTLKVVDLGTSPPSIDSISLDSIRDQDETMHKGSPTSLALPAGMAMDRSSNSLVIVGMGSNKIILAPSDSINNQITSDSGLSALGGPIAVIHSPKNDVLVSYSYVSNSINVYKKSGGEYSLSSVARLYNPEKPAIQQGRQYFYDASATSSNGRVSCGSCHIFGGDDKLHWDLSEAGKNLKINKLPFIEHAERDIPSLKTTIRAIQIDVDPSKVRVGDRVTFADTELAIKYIGDKNGFADLLDTGEIDIRQPGLAYLKGAQVETRLYQYSLHAMNDTWALIEAPFLHPLKGPMRTLPLHGIKDSGAMHFLGDIQGLPVEGVPHCQDQSEPIELRSLREFNQPCDGSPGSFETLLGGEQLDKQKMDALNDYILSLSYPPNPVRALDNKVNRAGEAIFMEDKTLADVGNFNYVMDKGPLIFRCVDCHSLDREANLFGTSKKMYSAPSLTLQDAKVPHLRFLYDRAGFYRDDYRNGSQYRNLRKTNPYYDEIIHANGYNHGGVFDVTMFFSSQIWITDPGDPDREKKRTIKSYEDLFDYLMGFDTNYYPMYGKQVTVDMNRANILDDIQSLDQFVRNALSPEHADQPQCGISYAVKDKVDIYSPGYQKDSVLINNFVEDIMRASINSGEPITLTCI